MYGDLKQLAKLKFDHSISIYDYSGNLTKSKPNIFGKMRENFFTERQKPLKPVFFENFSRKTLVKRGKSVYSLTAQKRIREKEGRFTNE